MTELDGFCMECRGRGGVVSSQDPVGDGVGFETLFDPCPACLGAGLCPLCGGPVDAEYNCGAEDCAWVPELVYEYDEPDDWEYWPNADYEDPPL
jgi:hypothetical protein